LASELLYFKIANRYNIIDKPNERSSHTRITLRGGGIIFYVGVALYFVFEGLQYPWFFAGLTLISLISFADDIRPQSSKIRIVIHFLAMGLMFYQWGLFDYPWYFSVIALVFCTGIINAYNFMDGINGITGGYSIVVAGCLLYTNIFIVNFVDSNLIYSTMLALLVFDIFNFRTKAKCFAGDVGAVSIAFILLFIIGKLVIITGDFSYIVFLAIYGVDSILTITLRLILKENIFLPHRRHAYQLLANELKVPHVYVSLLYVVLQICISIGYFAFKSTPYIYLVAVISILSFVYVLFQRNHFKKQNSTVIS
jgi:UDP-N-acetylmuramyl pentapeptide phosphotransferase/UDP-N-acetylglucosamine-1-phosphate transferase